MTQKTRSAIIKRKTKETDISGKLVIDGKGKIEINTFCMIFLKDPMVNGKRLELGKMLTNPMQEL